MKTSLEMWGNTWIKIYIQPSHKPRTVENYRYVLQVLETNAPDIWEKPLDEIEELDLQNMLNDMGHRYAKSTLHTLRTVLSQIYKTAIQNKLCVTNPAVGLQIPKYAAEKKVEAFSLEEEKLIRDAAPSVYKGDIAIFLLDTGLRSIELEQLEQKDYSSSEHAIHIRNSKTKAGSRWLPLTAEAEEILLRQPTIGPTIFTTSIGTPISKVCLQKLCQRLEAVTGVKDIHPHRFRHSFATRLVEQGVNVKALSDLLGHTDVSFTMARYVSTEINFLRSQIELLDGINQQAC